MRTDVRWGAVVVLMVLVGACGSSGPTSPSGTSQPPSLPPALPPVPINFPPLSGPSRTFIFKGELSCGVRDFTRNSRFVLYDNGAFVLQYPPSSLGDGAFRGQYRDASGGIMFLLCWRCTTTSSITRTSCGGPSAANHVIRCAQGRAATAAGRHDTDAAKLRSARPNR
jgi:hypothetical protein